MAYVYVIYSMDGANTCKPPVCKKKLIYFLQSWLGQTFRVWMGTADPPCVLCPPKISVKYEGKITIKIHAKAKRSHGVVSNKQKHAAIATLMQTASGVCVCVCVCVCPDIWLSVPFSTNPRWQPYWWWKSQGDIQSKFNLYWWEHECLDQISQQPSNS